MMIYVSAGSLLFMITRCADHIYLVQEFAFCNRAWSLGQARGGVEGTNFQASDAEFHPGVQGVCPHGCFETSSYRISAKHSAAPVPSSSLQAGGLVQLPRGLAELRRCSLTHFHCGVGAASPPARVCSSGDRTRTHLWGLATATAPSWASVLFMN